MRRLIAAVLIVISLPAFAITPRDKVFVHECKATNSANTGLRCGISGGKMVLRWMKDKKGMTPAQIEAVDYEYSRIIMRYFDLGGRQFSVTAEHWPKGGIRYCSIRPSRAVHCYTCDGSGNPCK